MPTTNPPNDPRAYWTQQAELAFDFMNQVRTYPLEESHEPLASLRDTAHGVKVDFATNLLGGLFPHQFFLRAGLIQNFRQVAQLMNDRGWTLKVEDGYRT